MALSFKGFETHLDLFENIDHSLVFKQVPGSEETHMESFRFVKITVVVIDYVHIF